ncbi:hypothetical protein Tco_1262739 [Tanacetum coccineum]
MAVMTHLVPLHVRLALVAKSNLVGELAKEYLMYYPSWHTWHKIEEEKKAGVLGRLMQHFDLTPRIRSKLWPKIKKGIGSAYGQDPDLPRTSSRHSGIHRLTIGLTQSTLPEPLKVLKTGQRARSYVGREPTHWLSFEISREDMSINEPRGTYIDADVDEIKEDSKRIRKELSLLRKVARSDDRVSQLLT